ncbi:MAG: circularly permuted type 2 ATP-grasp protein [Rhizobiales bacterium]|nr:circularly permuted type 2 ATP-grasp protein [Hyphomicrobiales bacterium]
MPGIPDEYIGPDGQVRAPWRRFFDLLGQQDVETSIAAADRHIRDMGISYRVHGEAQERAWPLSRLPLLIGEAEWAEIAAGVAQRAQLMEAVLADVYGPGRLTAEGLLPAAAVTGSPDYLRPLAGVKPPGGRWLNLYGVDIGRGPDGRWWALGDRAQAPSGVGYALENRLVMSRAFPALAREMNVARLAPFFRAFRAGLAAAAERSQPRICLLTPGPWSETYFEQTYLARYLGFLLVEGDDLIEQDGRVHVRTIAGLKRADVIWRRVDGDFVDPLELNGGSRLGVPGLVSAIRNGAVVVANMPGAGLIESRALLGFLPQIARRMLGEDLRMPHIATWWCGQEDARGDVLARFDQLALAPAFGAAGVGEPGGPVLPAEIAPAERERLRAQVSARGADFVGQEVVSLSTTPVWVDGKLAPRPFVLRVYAAATADGWTVMPGGFCRISDEPDARAVRMGSGVRSADVWVLSDAPVAMETLLPSSENVAIRRLLGNLPSRAADNLFWYGRYLERCEATARLVRVLVARTMEADLGSGGMSETLGRLKNLLVAWGAAPRPEKGAPAPDALTAAQAALFSPGQYGSARELVQRARHAASVIRERLSVDAWRLVRDLDGQAQGAPAETLAGAHDTADRMLRILAALAGLAQENTNHVAGWRFLDMGRRVERGINTCRFARVFADDVATADDLDILLDLIDSQITYRSRYVIGMALAPVRDMCLLDPFNPRSVGFQIARLSEHLAQLPTLIEDGLFEEPRRLVARLQADAQSANAEEIDARLILAYEQRLMSLADAVAARYFLQRPGKSARRAPSSLG